METHSSQGIKMNTVVWKPRTPETTQMFAFMQYVAQKTKLEFVNYEQLHAWTVNHPELFWQALCDFFDLKWATPAKQVLKEGPHMLDARWFEGATFNFAEKLLSRDDDHLALICIKESGERESYSYRELRKQVQQCAEGLRQVGVKQHSRVAAVLPNSAFAVIAMLATASLGAVWSSCSPDFGLDAIIDRLGQIEPSVIFMCDGYQYQGKRFDTINKLKNISEAIPSSQHIVICPFLTPSNPLEGEGSGRKGKEFTLWSNFLKPTTQLHFPALPFDHPLYILFSSGTTGAPKCIVHGAGGTLLQHIKELGLHTDIRPDDNLFFYTTCGWMMWNWMVSTLSLGATLTLYDGAPLYPNFNRLFQVIEKERVTVFGTSAKFLSSVEKAGAHPIQDFNLKSLRCVLSTGSPLLPQNYDFVYEKVKSDVQLCSISGGTDIVSCFALGNPILPIHRGELQCIGLGMDVAIFDEKGKELTNEPGELVCKSPFPSMPIYFWSDENQERYLKAYFDKYPNIWAHGDRAEITSYNGLIIYGRSDTVLNPGGVRIGTAEIYHQVEKIEEILDSVVIGQTWEDDIRVVLFVKLREGLILDDNLRKKIRDFIREHASPKHVPAKIIQVPDIPRTINGKVVEIAVRDTVEGKPIKNLGSIANPEALAYFSYPIE